MRKRCKRKAQAGESVCLCVNGLGWAVVILCMRQSFFVNGGVLVVGAVKATSLQHSRAGWHSGVHMLAELHMCKFKSELVRFFFVFFCTLPP